MKARMIVLLLACSSCLFLGFVVPSHVVQDQESAQEQKEETVKSVQRKKFMRNKLVSNQKIVEGLSLKDFDLVSEGASEVTAIVKGQHWFVLNTPEYQAYSQDMEVAAQRLNDAAKRKDIEAAALRYFDVTLKCIDCHQYLETLGH